MKKTPEPKSTTPPPTVRLIPAAAPDRPQTVRWLRELIAAARAARRAGD